jgi:hypothetical protein
LIACLLGFLLQVRRVAKHPVLVDDLVGQLDQAASTEPKPLPQILSEEVDGVIGDAVLDAPPRPGGGRLAVPFTPRRREDGP